MKIKLKNRFILLGVFILLAGLCLVLPLSATGPTQSHLGGTSNVYLLGIIDPDDRKHIWALPVEAAAGIGKQLAAKYPRKSIDGVTFYRVRSWRDTANLVIEAHAQQGALMVDLINRIERIKHSGPDRKLSRRVNAIEKRLNESLDSGYR